MHQRDSDCPIGANRTCCVSVFALALLISGVQGLKADVTLDGSMGPAGTLPGPDYNVAASLGRQVGHNLFHSFKDFSIQTGESATFSGPSGIHNVLGRVTGGHASNIDGLVRSTIPNADLYLLNPAGIVFGPNASLDVKGSFHAGSADYVRLEDGGRYDASDTGNSILTSAPVAAFGFLDDSPGPISVDRSTLTVPDGATLSLIGGDLTFQGQQPSCDDCDLNGLYAPGGRIPLISVASPGEVVIEDAEFRVESFARLGAIDSKLMGFFTRPKSGGNVYVRAGQLMFTESYMSASHSDMDDHPGTGIDINIRGDMMLVADQEDFEIASSASGAGRAGDIRIHADRLELRGNSDFGGNIGARVFASGDGGNIDISAGNIEIDSNAAISAQVFGSGSGGNIRIHADKVELLGTRDVAFISSSTFATGDAGDLDIETQKMSIRGGVAFTGLATQVASAAQTASTGGVLRLRTEKLEIFDGGQISAGIYAGSGRGGDIEIEANDIHVSGVDQRGFASGIYSNVSGADTMGSGGDIRLTSGTIQLERQGQINASSQSPGRSGSIDIKAGVMEVSGGAYVSVSGRGAGAAGSLGIDSGRLSFDGTASPEGWITGIFAVTGLETADGGSVLIQADDLQLLNGAVVFTRTFGSGRGGNINIHAERVLIAGRDEINGQRSGLDASSAVFGRFHEYASGPGGQIQVQADRIDLQDQGQILARSDSAGDGGNIRLMAENIYLRDGALVTAESTRSGDAGGIELVVEHLQLNQSGITTSAAQSDGGNIRVRARERVHLQDSQIVAEVRSGAGKGGNIDIDPVFIILDQSRISANAFGGPGGNIILVADHFIATPDSSVTASSSFDIDGNVVIDAPDTDIDAGLVALPVRMDDAASVLFDPCTSQGQGEAIHLTIRRYEVLPDSPYALRVPGRPASKSAGWRTSASARPSATGGSSMRIKCSGDA